jgi:hypothetical protein
MQLAEVLHQPTAADWRIGREKQVNVIRHQAIGMQGASGLAEKTAQVKEIKLAVLIFVEAALPIISALAYMYRDAGQHDSRASRH